MLAGGVGWADEWATCDCIVGFSGRSPQPF